MADSKRDWLDYLNLGLPVITFFLGFILSNIAEKRWTRKEQKATRNFFEEYWQEQLISAERLIESFDAFAGRLENYTEFHGVELAHEIQPFFMFDSMDKARLFDSFRGVGEEKRLMDRMRFIELVRASDTLCMRQFEGFLTVNNDNRERWNAALAEYRAAQLMVDTEVIRLLAGDDNISPEALELNRYFCIRDIAGSHDWVTRVIIPMEKYLTDVYTANPESRIAAAMLPALLGLRRAMEENIVHSKVVAQVVRNQIAFPSQQLDEIKRG